MKLTFRKVFNIIFFTLFAIGSFYMFISMYIPSSWNYTIIHDSKFPFPIWFCTFLTIVSFAVSIYCIFLQFKSRKIELKEIITIYDNQIKTHEKYIVDWKIEREKYQKELDNLN